MTRLLTFSSPSRRPLCSVFVCLFVRSRAVCFWQLFISFPLSTLICPDPSSCIFEGELFENEEEWYPDICTSCKCQNGVVICDTEECKALQCNSSNLKPIVPPGKCCPVCPNLVAQFESDSAHRRGDIPSINVTDVEEGEEDESINATGDDGTGNDNGNGNGIGGGEGGHEFEEEGDVSLTVRPVITSIPVMTTTSVPPPSPSSSASGASNPIDSTHATPQSPPVPSFAVDAIPEPRVVDIEVPATTTAGPPQNPPARPYPIAPANEPTEPGLITTTARPNPPPPPPPPPPTTTTTTTSTTTALPIVVFEVFRGFWEAAARPCH